MCITLKGIIIVSTENNVNGVLSDYHTATIISSTKIQKPKKIYWSEEVGQKKLYLLNVIINVIIIINTDIQFLVSFFVSSTKVLFFRILGWISFFRNTTKKLANTFLGWCFLASLGYLAVAGGSWLAGVTNHVVLYFST